MLRCTKAVTYGRQNKRRKKTPKSVQSNQSLWEKIFPGDFIVLKYCLPLFYLCFNVAHSQKICKTCVLLRFGGIIGHKFTSWPEMCLNVCLSAAYLFFRMYVEGEHRYKWVFLCFLRPRYHLRLPGDFWSPANHQSQRKNVYSSTGWRGGGSWVSLSDISFKAGAAPSPFKCFGWSHIVLVSHTLHEKQWFVCKHKPNTVKAVVNLEKPQYKAEMNNVQLQSKSCLFETC